MPVSYTHLDVYKRQVQSIGSGDLDARDVRGDLVVTSVGSGSVDHRGIGGRVRIPADD